MYPFINDIYWGRLYLSSACRARAANRWWDDWRVWLIIRSDIDEVLISEDDEEEEEQSE